MMHYYSKKLYSYLLYRNIVNKTFFTPLNKYLSSFVCFTRIEYSKYNLLYYVCIVFSGKKIFFSEENAHNSSKGICCFTDQTF